VASIKIRNLNKKFGALKVIENLSLDVEDGEFLVLLGPSGCGKSTLLRMLAGLEPISDGEIEIGGRRVEQEPPGERDIAFVFQSYALYPHLSVRRNIAFPLIMKQFRWWMHIPLLGAIMKRKIASDPVITETVNSVARTLDLTALMDRLPRTLSGGQRQRVALGRAMVRKPAVFLMDEPLSNLDAKLRTSMRGEISRLQARLAGTFVYVTHDQVEAMTMGTRIALMRSGVIQQIGTPRELFQDPANTFVARFVGTPPMNLVEAVVDSKGLHIGAGAYPMPGASTARSEVIAGIRPTDLAIREQPFAGSTSATVSLVEHLGTHSNVALRLDGVATRHDEEQQDDLVMVTVDGYSQLKIDQRVFVSVDVDKITLFDQASGKRLEREAIQPSTTAKAL
jgi:multiple sugar transport system ATP-binding protein